MGTMTDTMTAAEWAEKYGVTFDWAATGYHVDESGWEYHRYTVTLTRDGERVSFTWRQGLGIDSEPTVGSVLPALAMDAQYGALDWDDYCREFGYDQDEAPVREYKTWQACQEQNRKLYRFMVSEQMWDEFHAIEQD